MEELTTTDTIQKEILDEARRKAERLLKDADEEAARVALASRESAAKAIAEMKAVASIRLERFRNETFARIPLEKTRMRTRFIDLSLRNSMASFVAGLSEERIAGFCSSILARGAAGLKGKNASLRQRGLSAERAAAVAALALPGALVSEGVEDGSLPAAGLVVEALDGSLVVRATFDLVEESLLGDSRGELAFALCAEALAL